MYIYIYIYMCIYIYIYINHDIYYSTSYILVSSKPSKTQQSVKSKNLKLIKIE